MSDTEQRLNRRRLLRLGLYNAVGASVGFMMAFGKVPANPDPDPESLEYLKDLEWGFIVDTNRCIGCGSCVRACRRENAVPEGYFRTWVERYEIDDEEAVHVDSPDGAENGFAGDHMTDRNIVKAFFVPKLCNHCRQSACTQVCPVGATFESPDGVVLIDKSHCVGCGYCVQACPYGCRYIDHSVGTADKCTLCYHRIHKGLPNACVQACPREARLCGDLSDPKSRIRRILHERRYSLLKPEMGTSPKCYYIGLDIEVV